MWPGVEDGWCILGGGGVEVLIFTMMGVVRALNLLGSDVIDGGGRKVGLEDTVGGSGLPEDGRG